MYMLIYEDGLGEDKQVSAFFGEDPEALQQLMGGCRKLKRLVEIPEIEFETCHMLPDALKALLTLDELTADITITQIIGALVGLAYNLGKRE